MCEYLLKYERPFASRLDAKHVDWEHCTDEFTAADDNAARRKAQEYVQLLTIRFKGELVRPRVKTIRRLELVPLKPLSSPTIPDLQPEYAASIDLNAN